MPPTHPRPASVTTPQPHRPVNPYRPVRFRAGDHHVHSAFSSDGQYPLQTHAAMAARYGLDWMVVTDHGGVAHEKLSWDLVVPAVEAARAANPGLLLFTGLEWNVPGADHATVVLPPGPQTVAVLREFEAVHDAALLLDRGVLARLSSADGEPHALAGIRHLAAQVAAGRVPLALMIANHPSRRGVDSPHELRAWRDADPTIAIGMEGAPGHQGAAIPPGRGGRGRPRGYYDQAPSVDSFRGFDPGADGGVDHYRTAGGFDAMTATVGGLWDGLLAEGRPWWVTATSDSHQVYGDTHVPGTADHASTGTRGPASDTGVVQLYADFWPGQYSRTLVGADLLDPVEVLRGLRSGVVIACHGRLVDGLDVRVRSLGDGDRHGVTLGGRLPARRGDDVELTVTVAPAAQPNAAGDRPRLRLLDVIAGPVTGPAADRDTMTAPETAVAARFEPGPGAVTVRHVFRAVQRSFYLRLRGSDGNRVGPDGGPLVDPFVSGPADDDPWADLWLYANPVFVDVG